MIYLILAIASRCDIKDIQLYNMSTPTAPELTEKLAKNVKFIEDLLYDVEGSTDTRQMKEKQMIMILSVILFVIVILGSVATCFVCLHKKTGKKGPIQLANQVFFLFLLAVAF